MVELSSVNKVGSDKFLSVETLMSYYSYWASRVNSLELMYL